MIRVGGVVHAVPGEDTQYNGLYYPDGDSLTRHMAERLRVEPFYNGDKLAQALAKVKRFRVAVDCGAWVGAWSRALSKRFATVYAFEANPHNARCVDKNTPGNVEVFNVAVGDRTGSLRLENEGNGVGSTASQTTGEVVPLFRIDDYGWTEIDYIKIHVNGMELKALRGAVKTIETNRPVLTVVLKPAIEQFGDTAEAARKFLTELKYKPAGGERPYEIWLP